MATVTVGTGSSPDAEFDLGYHTVTFETDSDALARQAAERINAAVVAEFTRQRNLLEYSLELEIVSILPGSKRVVVKAKVKKTTWGRFKKFITPLLASAGIITGAMSNYDDLRGGAFAMYEDLKSAYEYIINQKPTTPPPIDYKADPNEPVST